MIEDSCKEETDYYNYGIAAIKIVMTFEVILCHFWSVLDTNALPIGLKFFESFRFVAVPVFMIITFYLLEPKLQKLDKGFIKKRMFRLFVPYVVWAIIYYIIIYAAGKIGNIIFFNKVSLKSLGWQLLLGTSEELCPHLWFMSVLIILTLLLFVLFSFFDCDVAITFLFFGAIIALFFQYSGLNYAMFDHLGYELKYPLGRIMEMLPFSFIGILLAEIKFKKRNIIQNGVYIAGYALLIFLINEYNVFSQIELSFAYAGIRLIIVSTLTVIIGITSPTTRIPLIIKKSIKILARYSFGVYCIHWGVGLFLTRFLSNRGIVFYGFLQCVIIGGISYVLSYIIGKIPFRICNMLVE